MKKIILSCEHGGNEVPEEYGYLFEGHNTTLQSHRGWDIGALDLARASAGSLYLPLHFLTVTRLLVELNRSPQHPDLFSEFTATLPEEDRQQILKFYYFPYRNEIEGKIQKIIDSGEKVLHLSIHSFTPVLDNVKRDCDVGLLYDPQRPAEKEFCQQWKTALLEVSPNLRVRFNYPYSGKSDGFTTYLRKQFASDYLGIELEVNQALLDKSSKTSTINSIVGSLKGIK